MKKDKTGMVLNLIIVCAVCIMIYGIWNIGSLRKEYGDAASEYEKIQQEAGAIPQENSGNTGSGKTTDPDLASLPEIDLKTLQAENEDTVAWLYYPALGINYPIMQDQDNQFYLTHTFSGEKNRVGSIFLDAYASRDFSDKNTFIYGHNMKDGQMFSQLKDIREEGFAAENPYFFIYGDGGWKKYRIFSYHDANADKSDISFQIQFENEQAFQKFIKDLQDAAEENLNVEVTGEDYIVTLATCTSDSSMRLLVHGVLEE